MACEAKVFEDCRIDCVEAGSRCQSRKITNAVTIFHVRLLLYEVLQSIRLSFAGPQKYHANRSPLLHHKGDGVSRMTCKAWNQRYSIISELLSNSRGQICFRRFDKRVEITLTVGNMFQPGFIRIQQITSALRIAILTTKWTVHITVVGKFPNVHRIFD